MEGSDHLPPRVRLEILQNNLVDDEARFGVADRQRPQRTRHMRGGHEHLAGTGTGRGRAGIGSQVDQSRGLGVAVGVELGGFGIAVVVHLVI